MLKFKNNKFVLKKYHKFAISFFYIRNIMHLLYLLLLKNNIVRRIVVFISLLIPVTNLFSQCAGNWAVRISNGGATWTSDNAPANGCLYEADCGKTINVYVCNKFSIQFQANSAFNMSGGKGLVFQDSYNDPAGPPWPDYKYTRKWQSSANGTSNWMDFGTNPKSSTVITDDYSPVKFYRVVLVTDNGKNFFDGTNHDATSPPCEIKFRVVHSSQWQTPPFGTKTTNVTSTSFRAEWDALTTPTWTENSGIDGEAISIWLQKETAPGTWVDVYSPAEKWVPGGQTATYYDFTGLTTGTKYRWCVRKFVVNGFNTFTPCGTPPCPTNCFTPGSCSVWREVTVDGNAPPPPPPPVEDPKPANVPPPAPPPPQASTFTVVLRQER